MPYDAALCDCIGIGILFALMVWFETKAVCRLNEIIFRISNIRILFYNDLITGRTIFLS